jgi:dihydrolipoamide dehydrogenase
VGKEEYQARKALVIATGSRVKGIPQIGLEIDKNVVISSDEALFLEKPPASLAVVGAGAVGCEFADIFNAFGTKVTLIEVLPRILPLEDAEASDTLAKSYKKRGINVRAGVKVKKAAVAKDKASLELDSSGKSETIEVEKVLMAAGRAVNTENLGLKEAGVQLTDRGFIKVNPATLKPPLPGYMPLVMWPVLRCWPTRAAAKGSSWLSWSPVTTPNPSCMTTCRVSRTVTRKSPALD